MAASLPRPSAIPFEIPVGPAKHLGVLDKRSSGDGPELRVYVPHGLNIAHPNAQCREHTFGLSDSNLGVGPVNFTPWAKRKPRKCEVRTAISRRQALAL